MQKVILVLIAIVGLINFLPVIGVFSSGKIAQAYAVELASPDLAILMRHRALLFGLIGAFVMYSLFVPTLQNAALTLATASMLGFLVIMWLEGGANAALQKIAIIDLVGIACVLVVAVLKAAKVDD